jgi:hypothetical protein
VGLPAEQIVTLTYIAERTNVSYDAVAEIVIANLERAPSHQPPQPRAFPPPSTPGAAKHAFVRQPRALTPRAR